MSLNVAEAHLSVSITCLEAAVVHLEPTPAQLDAIKLVMETQINFTISDLKAVLCTAACV